jgi:hypothetical protein
MTTYLLKLHCLQDIGGVEPRPTDASQWEGAKLKFKPPYRITGGRGTDVVDGDKLIVWTHEAPSFGRGLGLTAEGVASAVQKSNDGTASAIISQVKLLKPHFRLRGWNRGTTGSRVIDYLLRYILSRTYELDGTELSEFRGVVDNFMSQASALVPKSDEDEALIIDKDAVGVGFERRYAWQETRPGQADFRAAVVSLYSGRCAITDCDVDAALQAAHVVPFSENVGLRNEPTNGLLLRSDVHALFDKALISIDPATYRVVLSEKLRGTQYSGLRDRAIKRLPAEQFLEAQFRFFRKKQIQ